MCVSVLSLIIPSAAIIIGIKVVSEYYILAIIVCMILYFLKLDTLAEFFFFLSDGKPLSLK